MVAGTGPSRSGSGRWSRWGSPTTRGRHPGLRLPGAPLRPGRVRGRSDYDLHVERGLEATADADLVCLSPKHEFLRHDPAVLEAVRAAYDRGAIIYAHCSGVFDLGAAGLLRRPRCTTHWRYTDLLAATYPRPGHPLTSLLPRRHRAHRGVGGRHRRLAAPAARAVRRSRGGCDRAPDRGAAAPATAARRSSSCGRCPTATRRPGTAAAVDRREPRRGPQQSRGPGAAQPHVRAHLRPVPGRDRHHPRTLGDPAAGPGRRGSSSAPTTRSTAGRRRGGLRQRGRAASPTSARVRGLSPQQYPSPVRRLTCRLRAQPQSGRRRCRWPCSSWASRPRWPSLGRMTSAPDAGPTWCCWSATRSPRPVGGLDLALPPWKYFRDVGADVDLVGPDEDLAGPPPGVRNLDYADPDFDRDHAGRWGRRSRPWTGSSTGYVAAYHPDVVVELLGVNDARGAVPPLSSCSRTPSSSWPTHRTADPTWIIVLGPSATLGDRRRGVRRPARRPG